MLFGLFLDFYPLIVVSVSAYLFACIILKIRLLEHFPMKARKFLNSDRAQLFGEQSIASLPKKHCFPP